MKIKTFDIDASNKKEVLSVAIDKTINDFFKTVQSGRICASRIDFSNIYGRAIVIVEYEEKSKPRQPEQNELESAPEKPSKKNK